MNYKAVIKMSDKPKWDQAINEEHEQMTKMGVWEAVPRSKVQGWLGYKHNLGHEEEVREDLQG